MTGRQAAEIFAIGTVATFVLAAWLLHEHHPAAAAATIVISPFPCPPGLPC